MSLVLVIALAASTISVSAAWAQPFTPVPPSATGSASSLSQLVKTVRTVMQQIRQALYLVQNWQSVAMDKIADAISKEWGSEWGDDIDFLYSARDLAYQLQGIGQGLGGFGGSSGSWIQGLVGRLLSRRPPAPGSPSASATALAQQYPPFAARAHAIQQAQVGTIATQAAAQAAAQQSGTVATQVTGDTTAQDSADLSAQVAQQTQDALRNAPSTRAAVAVMGTALAQQQADQAAQSAALAAKLDALITQQAYQAVQVSQAVAGVGAATGVLAQQAQQQLEDEAQAMAIGNRSGAGALQAVADELRFLTQGPSADDQTFLDNLGQLR